MEQQEDRPGADRARKIDRGTDGDVGRETTPIHEAPGMPTACPVCLEFYGSAYRGVCMCVCMCAAAGDPDDLPIAPGLELAGGDRAAQDLRAAAATQRWRDRRPSRRAVALAGARGVLAAIERGARGAR